MLPFPSYYYGLESLSSSSAGYSNGFMHGGLISSSSSSMEMIMDGNTNTGLIGLSRSSTPDMKAIAACKSHSEAERRRRERINGHLATLRTLLPSTIKTDKASLLAEVVQHVKELKKVASEITAAKDGDGCRTEWWPFPRETDELTLSYCEQKGDHEEFLSSSSSSSLLIRVSLSCDDRPDLMADLTLALKSVGAKVVKAEITTVGGRTKSVLIIQRSSGAGSGGGGGGGRIDYQDLGTLRKALKAVLDKPASVSGSSSSSVASGGYNNNKKRPRLSSSSSAASGRYNDF